MPTIQVELSSDQLLMAVAQLSSSGLEQLVTQVVTLQAQRQAPSLPHAESNLLLKINEALPAEIQQRYDELIGKRRAQTLTPEEYTELLHLTSQVEAFGVRRMENLVELARLRQTSLTQLIDTLGIRPSDPLEPDNE